MAKFLGLSLELFVVLKALLSKSTILCQEGIVGNDSVMLVLTKKTTS